jgi:hypothetical protein
MLRLWTYCYHTGVLSARMSMLVLLRRRKWVEIGDVGSSKRRTAGAAHMGPTHALDASETRCFECPERETPAENTEIFDHPDSSAVEYDVAEVTCRSHPSTNSRTSFVENDRQSCTSILRAATATSIRIARKGKMRECIYSTDNCVAQVSITQA